VLPRWLEPDRGSTTCRQLFRKSRSLERCDGRLSQPAVAVETPRGWKISKEKQSHKIDVVVALDAKETRYSKIA
jgi:hypothetical protein